MPGWMYQHSGDLFTVWNPWRTYDGEPYPLHLMPVVEVNWTDTPPDPTAVIEWRAIVVCCGPDGALPRPVSRETVFETAAGIDREQWQAIATAEAAKGVYLETPGSVARYIWDRAYAFRPYAI